MRHMESDWDFLIEHAKRYGRSVTLDEIPVKYIIDVVDEKNEYKPFITIWDYEQENIEVVL